MENSSYGLKDEQNKFLLLTQFGTICLIINDLFPRSCSDDLVITGLISTPVKASVKLI